MKLKSAKQSERITNKQETRTMTNNTTVNLINKDEPLTRDEHFQNLNMVIKGIDNYFDLPAQDQVERVKNGLHRPWEITKDIFEEFLEMLPPVDWTSAGFYMLEYSCGNTRGHYFKKDGKHYCEEATYPRGAEFQFI